MCVCVCGGGGGGGGEEEERREVGEDRNIQLILLAPIL